MEIFRIKGILSAGYISAQDYLDAVSCGAKKNLVQEKENDAMLDGRRFIVQGVHDLWEIHPASNSELNWQDDEARTCKVIFIGRGLNEATLRKGLRDCFLDCS